LNGKKIIRGGYTYFPSERSIRKADIEITDRKINRIAESIEPDQDTEVISAESKLVTPGLIDLHAHLREPGREDTETLESGAWAALAGGFTTVCAMPNTNPATDTREQAAFIRKRSDELGLARILPIGAATKRREGKEISEYSMLAEGGIVAVSDDGDWIVSSEVMRHALEYASMLGLPVITHAEDPSMCEGGVMNESVTSARLGLGTRPPVAEEIGLNRDIALAAYTGSHLHVAHLTTARGVELVRQAKKQGARITAEVTPHHLLFSDSVMETFDSNYKINPPLRTEEDRKALIEGLLDGTIDAIATDHAPHAPEEKDQELDRAPAGMIGLQTALSVIWESLVEPKLVPAEKILWLFTGGPASVLGLEVALAEGRDADLVVFDPNASWTFDAQSNKSLSCNSPWFGKLLKGKVEQVLLGNNHHWF
jgi:dihydroorotase